MDKIVLQIANYVLHQICVLSVVPITIHLSIVLVLFASIDAQMAPTCLSKPVVFLAHSNVYHA
jgi:hypothetical protein